MKMRVIDELFINPNLIANEQPLPANRFSTNYLTDYVALSNNPFLFFLTVEISFQPFSMIP